MIRESIRQGLGQVYNAKRLIAWSYAWNLGFAGLATLPLFVFLNRHLSMSLLGDKRFTFPMLIEMIRYQSAMPKLLSLMLITTVLLFLIIRFWFSAGLFHYFSVQYALSLSQFLSHATRLFGRFFRLFLWCIPSFLILFTPLIIYSIGMRGILGDDPSQAANYWNSISKIVIFIVTLQLCGLVFDYARYHTLTNEDDRLLAAAFHGFMFLWRNAIRTIGLAWTIGILGLGFVLSYLLLSLIFYGHFAAILIGMILLQQMYIIARIMLRCMAIAAEAYLYKQLSNEAQLRRSIYEGGESVEPV